MMLKSVISIVFLLLTSCQTSYAWYHNHPERKTVKVDGLEISVVPRKANQFDAFGGDEGSDTNTAQLKERQTKAIELVSKCKVTSAEYTPGTWILQSVVSCEK